MWTFFTLFYALFFTYYTLYFPAVGKKKEKHEINVGIYFCIVPTICFISLFHGNCSLLPLLPLVPLFIEITFFICTKEKNLILRQSSDRLVIVAKGFLKLPNLYRLIKQNSPLLPRNLALVTSGELLIVFSTEVNLLYLLYSTGQRCCLLHLIKQNFLLKIFL